MNINFRSELESDLPTEAEFNSIPSLELVADEDNADAPRRQLILAPAIQEDPVLDIPPAPVIHLDPEQLQSMISIRVTAALASKDIMTNSSVPTHFWQYYFNG